jgi:hypothetical protein
VDTVPKVKWGYGRTPPPDHMVVFDPGKATGWCTFKKGKVSDWGICRSLGRLDDFLIDYVDQYGTPDKILYENFIVFGNKAQKQTGSKMEAPQAIGKIKFWAKMLGIEPEPPQMSNILTLAIKWSGVELGAHNNSHNKAALNHGVYWLVKKDMMLPAGMKD